MTAHTAGPWAIITDDTGSHVYNDKGERVPLARIAACVNACEGMEQPATAIMVLRHCQDNYSALRSRCESLEAALRPLLAKMEAAQPGELLTRHGYPKTGPGSLCLSCGNWTPASHSDAHEHKDGCASWKARKAYLAARHELASLSGAELDAARAALAKLDGGK